MSTPIQSTICFLLILSLVIGPTLPAWSKQKKSSHTNPPSVIIIDGGKNDPAKHITEELVQSLRLDPSIKLLDRTEMKPIAEYHRSDWKELEVSKGEAYLAQAKTHWFDRQYQEALANADQAIKIFSLEKEEKGALLLDTLLTKVLIYQETHRDEESQAVFAEALVLDPQLELASLPIRGRTKRAFQRSKQELAEKGTGSLVVSAKPPVTQVYLNGIYKGLAPLTLDKIAEGSYLVTLYAAHYRPITLPITITAETTQIIDKKLKWSSQTTETSNPFNHGLARNNQALKKMGESLKLDRIVILNQATKTSPYHLEIFDVALGAKYLSEVIPQQGRQDDLPRLKQAVLAGLSKHDTKSALQNPRAHIQLGTGDSRLLKEKKSFWKTKTFYTLLGVTVGAALGTTIGILVTREGDDPASALDAGGIEIEFE